MYNVTHPVVCLNCYFYSLNIITHTYAFIVIVAAWACANISSTGVQSNRYIGQPIRFNVAFNLARGANGEVNHFDMTSHISF